jgi:hypothetical protein
VFETGTAAGSSRSLATDLTKRLSAQTAALFAQITRLFGQTTLRFGQPMRPSAQTGDPVFGRSEAGKKNFEKSSCHDFPILI